MTGFQPQSNLLGRQLRKASSDGDAPDLARLLPMVDEAYCGLDRERKRTERAGRLMADELEAAMADSALQSRRFKLALDSMQEGLCMFDAESRLLVANGRFREIYGIAEDKCSGGTDLARLLDCSAELALLPAARRTALIREHSQASPFKANMFEQEWSGERLIRIVRHPIEGGGFLETTTDRTEAQKAERFINHLARHDPLTDLPNRTMMREQMDELVRNRRRGDRCAVLCLDLDRFKDVNDVLGHAVGDALLAGVADRLREVVRDEDMVVRMGGDEFAIILRRVSREEEVEALCQRVIDALAQPFTLGGHVVHTGASVGARLLPTRQLDPDLTLGQADTALYCAKAAGRGNWQMFNESMNRQIVLRRELEQDLRQAVVDDQFVVHYQPQIDLKSDRISSFEALVRWRHPTRGMVPPDDFIPVCEEIGLIDRLGEIILHRACADAANWPEDIMLAVNVSAIQFRSGNLVSTVSDALAVSGLTPDRLELEITESVIIDDPHDVLKQLHALKKLGVSISLDDFGTGYSSLNYIRHFPFDKVKIDRSFIRDLGSQKDSLAIVRAVAGMCGGLSIRSTAEGVETEDQLRFLLEEKYDSVQGYLFSPAVPVESLPELLERRSQLNRWADRAA